MKLVHRHVLLLIGFILLFTAACGCTTSFFNNGPAAEYPVIGSYEDDGRVATSAMEFPFQKETISMEIALPQGLYDAAAGADKHAVLLGEWKEDDDWTTGYYLSFLNSPAMEQVYSAVADSLKAQSPGIAGNSDEYLEYLTVYVQSLAYDVRPDDSGPKFPVETVIEQAGDCDDKSILLAGLLAREGYDVSLFYFPDDAHMAVGVGTDEPGYRDSGYLFIETTNLSLVGIPTENFENGDTLTADLYVITVGNGTRTYGLADETRKIDEAADTARTRAEDEEAALIEEEADLARMKQALDDENAALSLLKRSGDISGYNAAVADYNRHAAEYNRALEEYRAQYDTYIADVEFFNYVATHLYDRPGLSEKVADWEGGHS